MDPWSMDLLRGPGSWTGSIKIWTWSMDSLSWTGSMDPLIMDWVHGGGPWTPGPCFVLSRTRATSVTLLDRAGIPVHRIMQVSGHKNQGSVKVYCERQKLQQQKQCSEILAAPVASWTALITKSPQQLENRNSASCQNNMFTITNSPKFVDV